MIARTKLSIRYFLGLSLSERFLVGAWLLIITLIPFHALISTWGGVAIGPLEAWKSWKEILLVITLLVGLPYLAARGKIKAFFTDKLVWLVLAYALLHLLWWLVFTPELDSALAGMLMNLRFLGVLLLTMVILTFVPRKQLLSLGLLSVVTGGLLVIAFGLLQATILPDEFLRHFGYSKETIAPVTTLDNNHSIVRLQSTLRGPNPLGQYLIVIILLLAAWWRRGQKAIVTGCLLAAVYLLFHTYSRSAWIGMVVAAAVFVALQLHNPRLKRLILGGGAIVLAGIVIALLVALPQSAFLQNAILHNKNGDTDAGSTAKHWEAGEQSVQRILVHPFGQGPGTAGPASFYGPQERIPENYFLQITEEVGIIGLALFVAINCLVVARIWRQRQKVWAAAWLAAFTGITVVNIFLHGWADDTIAIIWWGLAAVFFAEEAQ